ncbi:hypothetical protein C0Z01_13165 [Photobacterium kishitanii]|uniref:hypothetical protein n=1 Tax=Photobacterium kishitanii TaxID=318456 RepID=UPI0007F00B69|nr:hypothetical protein [Photobacterium kishitanii]OBU28017.1 hypothetical protein AYY22_15220 [Photobacterium kishitanii]PSU97817.1 hypothetical protein C0W35_00360 [Photobacterium kishitanii]PSW68827.1 hypothetical protein C0Z01_13165 [Photobacterium kishitanii]
MNIIEFKLGKITYHFTVSEQQQALLSLTDETRIDLTTWQGFSEALETSIIKAIPEALTPPSAQEIKHAQTIAHELNLLLPDDYTKRVIICRQFIQQHLLDHQRLLSMFNNVKGKLLK